VPVVLLTNHLSIKTKTDIFKLGLDDVFDGSTVQELFYERIDLVRRTKQRLLEGPGDKLQLSVANIDISINVFKRIGDVMISCALLIALAPLFLIVAIFIKIESRGPVFYTSKRAGAGYKIFDFYKFRSMAQGSDQEMSKVLHLNQYDDGKEDSNSVFYKIKGDPRVTKVGAFLRKTSIDELPQLINVLKGDMSLVGNRPLPLYEAQQLTRDNWVARFNAPAGITGLWQISKRGKAEMSEEERVDMDVEYSRMHSFWYDLLILIRTIPVVFQEDDV
jgi:lipopolysaccharide/colanic/teichoic acid biosynthesis glycosyltransferase